MGYGARTLMIPLLAGVVLTAGCAGILGGEVREPATSERPAFRGDGEAVAVAIVDRRAAADAGSAAPGVGRQVLWPDSTAALQFLRDESFRTLSDLGFEPLPADRDLARRLTVEVTILEYELGRGPVSGDLEVRVALRGVVRNLDQAFGITYRMTRKDTGLFDTVSGDVQRTVNQVLDQVLAALLREPQLLSLLAH